MSEAATVMAASGAHRRSVIARLLAGLSVPFFVFALASPSSAHSVTGVTATCDRVSINWSDFPPKGVPVHVTVDVAGFGSTSRDVVVDSTTASTSIDISAITNAMHGEAAAVVVDATWTLDGAQHAHEATNVTCGEASAVSTPTTAAPSTDSTTPTSSGSVIGGVTSESSGPTTPTRAQRQRQRRHRCGREHLGRSARLRPTPPAARRVSPSGSSLPFTGSSSLPLALVGLGLVASGVVLAIGRGDRGIAAASASPTRVPRLLRTLGRPVCPDRAAVAPRRRRQLIRPETITVRARVGTAGAARSSHERRGTTPGGPRRSPGLAIGSRSPSPHGTLDSNGARLPAPPREDGLRGRTEGRRNR